MANETSKTTSPGNASPTPQQIPLAQIRDLPGIVNIRTYTPKDLGGLVSSIQSVGVREPIIVRRSEDGMYQLLAGQRRRKASELAKKYGKRFEPPKLLKDKAKKNEQFV